MFLEVFEGMNDGVLGGVKEGVVFLGVLGGVKDGVVDCVGVFVEFKLKGIVGVVKFVKLGVFKGVWMFVLEDVIFLKIFFVGVGGGKLFWDLVRLFLFRFNKFDFFICFVWICWKNKLLLVGGVLVEVLNGVVGLLIDFCDCC